MKKSTFSAKQLTLVLAVATTLGACDSGGGSEPLTSFSRVDRTGQPAVATALLSRDCPGGVAPCDSPTTVQAVALNPGAGANPFNDQRDQFNRGDPANDGQFAVTLTVGPQSNSLQNIHFEVRPQLLALGLAPCSTEPPGGAMSRTQVDISRCVAQAAPVIIPDAITYTFAAPAGWPNGRHYDDPVVDRLLAAALLDLSAPGQNLNTLVGVLNRWTGPAQTGCVAPCAFTGDETNTPSPATFPFLRPAHP